MSLSRRTAIAGGLACTALTSGPGVGLLNRAIRAAGGHEALSRVSGLGWTGEAEIHAGGQDIRIAVETRVSPFRFARSDTWIAAQGRGSLRSLIVDATGAWQERGGIRTALPDAQARHERQQFAIYGLMLLTPLLDTPLGVTPDGALVTHHPSAPETILRLDNRGRLVAAENTVDAPDGAGRIAQRFDFSGEITSRGVRWPRVISIRQDGKPYFDLMLETFAVS